MLLESIIFLAITAWPPVSLSEIEQVGDPHLNARMKEYEARH